MSTLGSVGGFALNFTADASPPPQVVVSCTCGKRMRRPQLDADWDVLSMDYDVQVHRALCHDGTYTVAEKPSSCTIHDTARPQSTTYHFVADEYEDDGAELLIGKFNAPDDQTAETRCRAICQGYIHAMIGGPGDDNDRPDCMSVTLRRGIDEYGDEIATIWL